VFMILLVKTRRGMAHDRYVTNHLGQLSLPSIVNRVPACPAGVKEGCVHLCRVPGNNVLSHMTRDPSFQGGVFGDGGSNGAISDWIKSNMAASGHLEKL